MAVLYNWHTVEKTSYLIIMLLITQLQSTVVCTLKKQGKDRIQIKSINVRILSFSKRCGPRFSEIIMVAPPIRWALLSADAAMQGSLAHRYKSDAFPHEETVSQSVDGSLSQIKAIR